MKVLHHVLDARDHTGTDHAVREAVVSAMRVFRADPTNWNTEIPTRIFFHGPQGKCQIERLHVVTNPATREHTITAFWHLDRPNAPWMSTRFQVTPELLAS